MKRKIVQKERGGRGPIVKGKASRSDIQVNPTLTNISVAHTQDVDGFVHAEVFPIVPVSTRDGFYFVFDRSDMLRVDSERRSPGTIAAQKTVGLSRQTYSTEQWALAGNLPDEFRDDQDSPFADEKATIEPIVFDLLMQRELQFLATFFNTGLWAIDYTGVAAAPGANQFVRWSAAAPTIIRDVLQMKREVKVRCGKMPNTLVLPQDVFDTVINDNAILARINGMTNSQNPAIVTQELLAQLFGLKRVLVASAVRNTASEGLTFAGTFIFSNQFLLCYVPDAPAKRTQAAGYIFSYSEVDDVDAKKSGAPGIRTWRDEPTRSDYFEGIMEFDMAIVDANCGLFATSVLS